MILRKFESNPAAMVRFGRILLSVGLLIVAAGISWPRLPFHASLSPSLNDFIQGSLLGLGIALEIGSVFIVRKASCLKPHAS